jgi:hypothetical protein
MIYTSYFARFKDKKVSNIISIARWPPRHYKGFAYPKLAPTWPILNDFKKNSVFDHDAAVAIYIKAYQENILNKLNQKTVFNELTAMCPDNDIILLCYEAPNKFCHRHLVSQWFRDAGIEAEECYPQLQPLKQLLP